MSSINKKMSYPSEKTFEGGNASRISKVEQLRRSVMCCMLWEDSFYEDGIAIADRIKNLVASVGEEETRQIMFDAKEKSKLRHIPLYMATLMAEHKWLKKEDVERIITRADDMTELLSLYWKEGKKPLSKAIVRGLQLSFKKFDEYNLAKWNRAKEVKLRDVLRIARPKPENKEQAELWGRVIKGELATPDTWEVAISACKNDEEKRNQFERLINNRLLGDLAFIRNLRKMNQVSVNENYIKESFKDRKWSKILPFQFITSARYCPDYEPELESAMLKCMEEHEKINRKVTLLVDVSGSMEDSISNKSETTRIDVACGLGILLREICTNISIYTFSDDLVKVPARRGFALCDAINNSQGHAGTYIQDALDNLSKKEANDLLIIITDEQSADNVSVNKELAQFVTIINVASYQNGVAYGKNCLHISGWSESVVDYLQNYLKDFSK